MNETDEQLDAQNEHVENVSEDQVHAGAPNEEAPSESPQNGDAKKGSTDEAEAGASETSASETEAEQNHYLEDLQRLSAEYANYRKRVDRDKADIRDLTIAGIVKELISVLDDIDRARAAGDVQEGSAVSMIFQKLEDSVTNLDVTRFGVVGEPFDPKIHEAVAQVPTKDVAEAVLLEVTKPGYIRGERLIRAAEVVVAVPLQ